MLRIAVETHVLPIYMFAHLGTGPGATQWGRMSDFESWSHQLMQFEVPYISKSMGTVNMSIVELDMYLYNYVL